MMLNFVLKRGDKENQVGDDFEDSLPSRTLSEDCRPFGLFSVKLQSFSHCGLGDVVLV